jgi:hypothetical protein
VRRGCVDHFNRNPSDRAGKTDRNRSRERCGREESESFSLQRDRIHPDNASLGRGPLTAVMIEGAPVDMQMDGRVRVVRACMVGMLGRQRRGERDTRRQSEADDRRAQSFEHVYPIMVGAEASVKRLRTPSRLR